MIKEDLPIPEFIGNLKARYLFVRICKNFKQFMHLFSYWAMMIELTNMRTISLNQKSSLVNNLFAGTIDNLPHDMNQCLSIIYLWIDFY